MVTARQLSGCASREGSGGRKRMAVVEGGSRVLGKAGGGGLYSSSVGAEGFVLLHTHSPPLFEVFGFV